MPCVHLSRLYQLCEEHDLRFTGPDLVRLVCRECGETEVCPSVLMDEYDSADKPAPDMRGADGGCASDPPSG